MSRELLQQCLDLITELDKEGMVLEAGLIFSLRDELAKPEPKLTNAGADTNISRGLEPKGSGMVTLHQPEQADRKTLIECIAGSISMHMTIGLYPKELLAAAEYIVDNYTAPPGKPWVGLTAEEIFEITERLTKEGGVNRDGWIVAVEVQQKLKEKNT